MDKLKFAEWGEKLKTSGSQMGRTISDKVKDLLQTPTPESKMVEDATAETLEEPNWGLNMRICALINSEEFNDTEIVKAIKRKINSKSVLSQRLSLDLLEACTVNCDKVCSAVASEKVLEDMVRMIDDPQTDGENRRKALQLIQAWGESEDLAYLSVFRQTYMNLKNRGASPAHHDESLPLMQQSLESFVHQDPLLPPESYPVPDTGMHDADNGAFFNAYHSMSVEEKKEFLVVTRNTLELVSSILNTDREPKQIKDDLTMSMLDKCRRAQPVLQRMIESTMDDDGLLFEALSLHDELQEVITKYDGLEAAEKSREQLPESSSPTEVSPHATSHEMKEADLSKGESDTELSKEVANLDLSLGEKSTDFLKGESNRDLPGGERRVDLLEGESNRDLPGVERGVDLLEGESNKDIPKGERSADITKGESNKDL